MKHLYQLTFLICSAFIFSGCGKNNQPHPKPGGSNNSGYSFENTEWTGIANTYGQTYPQPLYLRFNGHTTVSAYALFAWIDGNNIVNHDSVIGNITNIDTSTTGQTTITVDYPLSHDEQTLTIQNKNTMTGGSTAASQAVPSAQYSVSLQVIPEPVAPVSNSSWNTVKMTGGGPTQGMYEFPDINGITFVDGGKMTYTRNGKIITYTPPTQDQLLIEGYHQIGPMLLFAGYNEEAGLLIQYFGVLSADGKTIFADCSNRLNSRLPNYSETIYWYGPPGATPITTKGN
jgi:hypothetical protein